jgi:hypothetical protein
MLTAWIVLLRLRLTIRRYSQFMETESRELFISPFRKKRRFPLLPRSIEIIDRS